MTRCDKGVLRHLDAEQPIGADSKSLRRLGSLHFAGYAIDSCLLIRPADECGGPGEPDAP